MPMDTMMPVTPARSKLGASDVWPRAEMIDHKRAAGHGQPRQHDDAEQSVVDDRVEEHEQEAGDAGAEAGLERRAPEGGRHGLGGQRVEADRQRAELHGERQVLGVALGEGGPAADLSLAGERGERGLVGLDDRGRLDDPVELDGDQLVEVLVGQLVERTRARAGQ